MPFVSRIVKPGKLKRHSKKQKALFTDFNEVSNHTLSGILLQLASLCHHAEDVFGGISDQMQQIHRRCFKVSERIKKVQNLVEDMNPKTTIVPVSDLDNERSIPIYLQYRSPNALEEDLFTVDSRTPCLIHLHQKARQDLNYILRGSDAYAKQSRPKSLDPKLLMDEYYSPTSDECPVPSSRNSTFFSSPSRTNSSNDKRNLPSSEDRMKLDSSDCQGDVITIDTSGEKFDRQANLRRSQRLSSCTVRQRTNLTQRRNLRHRHKTLTGLPGNISAELDSTILRPYSIHSEANNSTGAATGSSFVDASSDESPSVVNGHSIVSPRRSQKNAEIQTDAVTVISLTPTQIETFNKLTPRGGSPDDMDRSSQGLSTPTPVLCPVVPKLNYTSTPINGIHENEMIRPTKLDVHGDDTSTDEGRHTGESNPTTPVHGHKREVSDAMSSKNNSRTNGNTNNKEDISMRKISSRSDQGEERTSSGCWSGTESTRHSTASDIMTQHAHVTKALQQIAKNSGKDSTVLSNSTGQISPIIDSRTWTVSSAVSSSVNSRLSTLERTKSNNSSALGDKEDLSPSSSVVSITLNRSNTNSKSNSSLNSPTESGTALSAASLMKKSRKNRFTATSGVYSFMNCEEDPLADESKESLSRTIKNRRSARLSKRINSTKRTMADDTLSVTSIADSSCKLSATDVEVVSVHSGTTNHDTASLNGSIFSVDQEGYYTSMHDDCGIVKTKLSPSVASVPPIAEHVTPDMHHPVSSPASIVPSETKNKVGIVSTNYDSYNRAVKSNHSTPKSLQSPRGKSTSLKLPRNPEGTQTDFQAELNKRLSLRRVTSPTGNLKSSLGRRKEKRGVPPPPPRRTTSLSNNSTPKPSPALSHKTFNYNKDSPTSPSTMSTSSISRLSTTSPLHQQIKTASLASEIFPMPPTEMELTYMETLPPPPTPEELRKVNVGIGGYDDTVDVTNKTNRPPPPLKPHRTSTILRESETKLQPSLKADPEIETQNSAPVLKHVDKTKPYYATTSSNLLKQTDKFAGGTAGTVVTSQVGAKAEKQHDTKNERLQNKQNSTEEKGSQSNEQSNEVGKVADCVTDGKMQSQSLVKSEESVGVSNAVKNGTVKKIPPVVSSKPNIADVEKSKQNTSPTTLFDEKRKREESPSYRSAAARAAFFASVTSPKQYTDAGDGKSTAVSTEHDVGDSSTDEICKDNKEIEKKSETERPVNKKEDKKEDQLTEIVKEKENETDGKDSKKEENAVANEEEISGSNEWLDKIEEISGKKTVMSKIREKSPGNTSAASRLLSSAKQVEQKQSPKFSTFDNLKAAIHKSKRDSLVGKTTSSSPPTSPGVNSEVFTYRTGSVTSPNGTRSPVSTLERKRNARLSTNGALRNGISRKSTGGTSRDDFKALLLQNACRGSSGAGMTAAEKLQRGKAQYNTNSLPRQRPHSTAGVMTNGGTDHAHEDTPDSPRPEFSLSDIQSALTSSNSSPTSVSTRQGRPVLRAHKGGERNGVKKAAAALSVHDKKHPPQSLSSKYNTRSRTPTRPMMSISEDNESEKSPEQAAKKSGLET